MVDTYIDRRIARTKAVIRDALVHLIEEKGFDALSVKDITTKANINRGTFYLHYRDKFDLLEHTVAEIIQNIEKIIEQASSTSIMACKNVNDPPAFIVKLFEYLNDNASLVQAVLGSKSDYAFQTKIKEAMWSNLFEKELPSFLKKDNLLVPTDYFVAYIASANLGVIQQWLQGGRKESPEEMALILSRLTFNGPFTLAIKAEEHQNGAR